MLMLLRWYHFLLIAVILALMGYIFWKLTPIWITAGALMFCLIYPGCHFQ